MSEELKETAKNILIDCAKKENLISYSDLVDEIKKTFPTDMGPHDTRLFKLLEKISIEENEMGHGMLSAVVVRQEDKQPGSGFFKLAGALGKNTSNKEECWTLELNKVFSQWK